MSEHADPPDIETYEDCVRLVTAFYRRAMTDPIIGFIFVDVAHLDLDAHIPVIASFWETILLGAGTYSGGAYAVHADLNRKVRLRTGHFERWVGLWNETVDELFAGQRADQAKTHARRVARAFDRRLRGLPPEPLTIEELGALGTLTVTQHGGDESERSAP